MTTYLGQINWVAFNFVPQGWAACDGRLLAIAQNQALFSLLGTTYGGNGVNTFGLPDLRGRTPLGGDSQTLGMPQGTEAVTLLIQQLPAHTHTYPVSQARGTTGDPGGADGATFAGGARAYTTPALANTVLGPTAITTAGATQPHNNMQPSLVLNPIIATYGIFPSRS